PAASQIYTLFLHDALPIYGNLCCAGAWRIDGTLPRWRNVVSVRMLTFVRVNVVVQPSCWSACAAAARPDSITIPAVPFKFQMPKDRKSTRLNSSHVKSSYA